MIQAKVALHRDARRGYYYIKVNSLILAKRLLQLMPYRMLVGMATLQSWVPRAFGGTHQITLMIP